MFSIINELLTVSFALFHAKRRTEPPDPVCTATFVMSQCMVKRTYSSTEYAIVVISAISAAEVSRREYCTTTGVSDSSRIA